LIIIRLAGSLAVQIQAVEAICLTVIPYPLQCRVFKLRAAGINDNHIVPAFIQLTSKNSKRSIHIWQIVVLADINLNLHFLIIAIAPSIDNKIIIIDTQIHSGDNTQNQDQSM